jgi:hypothetical protein
MLTIGMDTAAAKAAKLAIAPLAAALCTRATSATASASAIGRAQALFT